MEKKQLQLTGYFYQKQNSPKLPDLTINDDVTQLTFDPLFLMIQKH